MKITLEVSDVGTVELFSRLRSAFPSYSEEVLVEKLKELGKPPICQENFAAYLFSKGLDAFEKEELQASPDAIASGVYKMDTANILTGLTEKIIHVHVVHEAKLKAIKKEFGEDSQKYRDQSMFLAGVDWLIAVFDCEVTGKDEIRKALKAVMGEVPIEVPDDKNSSKSSPKPGKKRRKSK